MVYVESASGGGGDVYKNRPEPVKILSMRRSTRVVKDVYEPVSSRVLWITKCGQLYRIAAAMYDKKYRSNFSRRVISTPVS